jgi:hypothetical protein
MVLTSVLLINLYHFFLKLKISNILYLRNDEDVPTFLYVHADFCFSKVEKNTKLISVQYHLKVIILKS